jgi:hypothetical protein
MADTIAMAVVIEALALRMSHPHAPAADVLDQVMKGGTCRRPASEGR